MKVTLVGNHQGRACIHWPGVLVSSLLVAAVAALGAAAFSFAVGWYSPIAFILPIAIAGGVIIAGGVMRGLQVPPGQLPPIGPVA